MQRLLLLVCTLIWVVWCTVGAYAQNPVETNACQEAVTKEVRGRHPQARVQFLGDAHLSQASNAETGVKGAGQFQDREGAWRQFAYTCTYNIRSGQTYGVTVHARQAEAGSGGRGEPSDPEAHAEDVCWKAVVKEARGKYAADGVEMGDVHGWQESNAETGVRGRGVAVTPSGARTKFKFTCTYNIRSGETYGVEIRQR